MKKFMDSFKTRSFRVGGYSVVAAVILIAIIVLLNVLVSALPTRFTQLDLTDSGLYTLSPESRLIIRRADKDITVWWIVQKGKEDETVENLINHYAGENSRITIKKIDPDENPTFTDKYGVKTLYNNSLIIESGDLYRYVSAAEIYIKEYDYNNYDPSTGTYASTTVFDGENAITRAFDYVINGRAPKLCVLEGHGEEAVTDQYLEDMKNQNMTQETLDLRTTDSVPEDCDVLLVAAPARDISAEETDKISAYLERGGSVMFVTTPVNGVMPNIETLCAGYGMDASNGIIVETNTGYFASNYPPLYLLPRIETHTITGTLVTEKSPVFMPISSGITVPDELPDGVSVTKLLMTSGTSFLKEKADQTYEKEEGDTDGPFAVGALSEKTLPSGEKAQIVWFTSDAIMSDTANEMVSGTNGELFLSALSYLSGNKDSVIIKSKSITSAYLTVTGLQSAVWSIILIGVLPLVFIAAGIVIITKRKRR